MHAGRGSAGGIRTRDLELMRLARTAAPPPRKSGWQESNLRSPAPGAGGVASSPTARSDLPSTPPSRWWAAGSTSSPSPLRDRTRPLTARSTSLPTSSIVSTPGGIRTRNPGFCVIARFDHGGVEGSGGRLEPADGAGRLRVSDALLYQPGPRCLTSPAMPPTRESNPQGPTEPTRFRDGLRRRWQPFR